MEYVGGSLVAALMFAVWLLATAVRRLPLPRTLLDGPISLVLLAAVASVVFGAYPRLASEQLFFLVGLVLLYYLLLDLLPVRQPNLGFVLRGSVFGMGALFGAASVLGVLDWYLGLGIWWAGPGWIEVGGLADLWPPQTPRVGLGNIVWPTVHAGALVFVFGLSLPQVFAATGRQRSLWAGYAALVGAGLFFTYARGAWVAAAVVAALVVIAAGRLRRVDVDGDSPPTVDAAVVITGSSLSGAPAAARRRFHLVSTPTPVIAMLLVGGTIAATVLLVTGRGVSSDELRLELARIALAIFAERPIFGGGVGIFPYLMLSHWIPSDAVSRPREHAHNAYLNQMAEQGVLGVLASGVLVGTTLYLFYLTLRRPGDPAERTRALSPFAGLAAFAVHGLVDSPLTQAGLAIAAVYALALAVDTLRTSGGIDAVATVSIRLWNGRWPQPVRSAPRLARLSARWSLLGLLAAALASQLWYQPAASAQSASVTAAGAEQHEVAVRHLEQAVRLDPSFGLYREQLGTAYLWLAASDGRRQWLALARQELTRALAFNPRNAMTHALLGIVSRSLDERERAIAELRRAVELAPNEASFQVALGETLWLANREAGLTAYARALVLQPDHLASEYWQRLRPEERAEVYQTTLALASAALPEARALRIQGQLALAAGDLDRAGAAFAKLQSRYWLGRLARARGELGQARAHFTAELAAAPNAVGYLERGVAALELGEFDAAEQDLLRAAFAATDNVFLSSATTPVYYQLGRLKEARGDLRQAIELYQRGLPRAGRLLGYEPNVWRRPALPLGEPPQLAAYDLVRSTPTWRAPYLTLAAAYERAGRADLAIQLRTALANSEALLRP
ncbi:MAG: O-antigen ligase family protein [Chloroflexi bacterium]|nr:O-antigen ligase family protein [Chloroflexota bacterium]